MKCYLPFVIIAAVALLTVGTGTMLYRAKRLPLLPISEDRIRSGMDDAEAVHVRGSRDASVTLEEFADFQCPPCGALAPPINQLEQDYKSRLRIIFRHFPLPMHQHALEAALASEAAGLQGRFWEMHDLLYREQSIWTEAADVRLLFNAYARVLCLNIDRFNNDMKSDKVKARVTSDQENGAALGVTSTPTIFVNNRAVPPNALTAPELRAAIDAALNDKPKS